MTTLDAFRPGAATAPATRKAARKKAEWAPPTLADVGLGNVLAFDPSLSAMGFCALERTVEGLSVYRSATLRGDAPQHLTGWEQTLRQALILEARLRDLLATFDRTTWSVVHEAPPLGGGKLQSPESAILASFALQSAALDMDFEMRPMISPHAHKKATVGSSTIKKKEHHELLRPLLLALPVGNLALITNEAKRDAVSVGLADLLRRRAA